MGALDDLMNSQQGQGSSMSPLQALIMSGMTQAPQSAPLTRGLSDYEQRSPFDLAAMRTRETVRPTTGRVGEGPSLASILSMTPLGLADPIAEAGIKVGPEIATGGMSAPMRGSSANMATAQAAENPDAIKELQAKLRDGGYYRGPIDGRMGPATQEAKQRFDAAEQVRVQNETASKAADAQTAAASAQAELAKTQAANLKYKEQGSERLKQVENEVPWYRQAVRDYSGPAGLALGVAGGALVRKGVVAGSDAISQRAASNAESLFDKAVRGIPARSARVNEFFRKGGADQVPFPATPGKSPGVAMSANASPLEQLYQPSTAANRATDAGITGAFGLDALVGQFKLVPDAQERLRLATEAASKDPSEVNIRELQAAKDKLSIMEGVMNLGRGAGLSYLGSSVKMQRAPTVPAMDKMEKEKLALEALLRKRGASTVE